ncbi:MAG: hypothetical protein ACXW48_20630, partial [Candidatus Binatia bacterium]
QEGRFQTCPCSSEISFAIFARFAVKFPVPEFGFDTSPWHHGSRALGSAGVPGAGDFSLSSK